MDKPMKSLGERRMQKADDCRLWTPKELLEALLRDFEENPVEGLVVCYFRRVEGSTLTGMRRSKVTLMEAVAMIEMAKFDLLRID
jgi:hypothetical protein